MIDLMAGTSAGVLTGLVYSAGYTPDFGVEHFTEDGEFLLARGPEPWGASFKGRDAIRAALEQRFAAGRLSTETPSQQGGPSRMGGSCAASEEAPSTPPGP